MHLNEVHLRNIGISPQFGILSSWPQQSSDSYQRTSLPDICTALQRLQCQVSWDTFGSWWWIAGWCWRIGCLENEVMNIFSSTNLFNFTNQVFDMQLCLLQDWCTRQRKLSVCSCSESSRHLLNLSDSSFQKGLLLQLKFSKLKEESKRYLQKRVMYSLLSSIFPQMLAIVGRLLEFRVKQPAGLDKFLL